MNRKGETLGGWVTAIILSALFMVMIGAVIGGMNVTYGQDKDPTLGLGDTGEDVINNFESLGGSIEGGIESGEADFDSSSGLQISTLWTLLTVTWRTIGSFLTGGWIEKAVSLTNLPVIFGTVLRLLYLISIGFILIKLILKLKP